MNISPGIIGTYWALTNLGLTALWAAACETTRAAVRRRDPMDRPAPVSQP